MRKFLTILLPIERYASHAPLDYPGIPKEVGEYAGLIVLGGPMSANDTPTSTRFSARPWT